MNSSRSRLLMLLERFRRLGLSSPEDARMLVNEVMRGGTIAEANEAIQLVADAEIALEVGNTLHRLVISRGWKLRRPGFARHNSSRLQVVPLQSRAKIRVKAVAVERADNAQRRRLRSLWPHGPGARQER